MADVRVENHGSLFMFTPLTEEARTFVTDKVDVPDWAWMGASFAVDHRMARDLAEGMRAEGLVLE